MSANPSGTKHDAATLHGAALDAAVAKATGYTVVFTDTWRIVLTPEIAALLPLAVTYREGELIYSAVPPFSNDWRVGGRLIEENQIELHAFGPRNGRDHEWMAQLRLQTVDACYGPTPLIAAARAFVRFRLGKEIDLP